MKNRWLYTTAVALLIGTGPVFAQSQQDLPQKREEGVQKRSAPGREADRPAASEQRPTDRMRDREVQSEPKAGAKEPQRGETTSPSGRKQAEEPTPRRDTAPPTKQSQEQRREQQPGERPPPSQAQQKRDEEKGRGATRPNEPVQRQGRDEQRQDSRERDVRRPSDSRQQQGQQQPERDRDQAAQPSATPGGPQGARPGETAQDRQRGRDIGQTPDQSAQREGRPSVSVNQEQRTQIMDRLRSERASNENINVRVNVGERLPPEVLPRPLPLDIVRIAPQYRDYEYTVIEDRVAIVDPRTREVVDFIDEPGRAVETTSGFERRVVVSGEQRDLLKRAARSTATVGSNSSSGLDSRCLALQPVPEELVRNNPELASYRYLAIGDEIVLVDPRQQKVVQVID
jgi:hypothetical protein